MKNSRRCPKCGSEEVICCQTAEKGQYDRIPVGFLGQAHVDRWVCCTCGYCELWAAEKDLEKLKKIWGPKRKSPE